jgi:DivIVA domain-containing protein
VSWPRDTISISPPNCTNSEILTKPQDVDDYLDLIAANLALPLAQRTIRPEEVRAVIFTATAFRDGYDEAEVDRVLDQLAVELGLASRCELRDAPSPRPLPSASPSAPPVVTAPPTTPAQPTDDYRPDPTF